MKALETRIPPPLVALIFALILWGLANTTFGLSFDDLLNTTVRISLSILLLVIGAGFSILGVVSFKKAKTTVNPLKPQQASTLVNSGIYQITRNPMYVGFVFFLIALSIFLNSFLFIVLAPLFMLYITYFQIIPEERALETLFSEHYLHYKKTVRRWL